VDIPAVVIPIEFNLPGKININTASAADLEKLPGIGSALAARIVAYREEHGPFAQVDDLTRVPGIGPKTLDGFRDLVTVGEE
jgi:competence protein ComEA